MSLAYEERRSILTSFKHWEETVFDYNKKLDADVLLTMRQKRHCKIATIQTEVRKRWVFEDPLFRFMSELGFPSTRAIHTSIQRLKADHPHLRSCASEHSDLVPGWAMADGLTSA